MELKKITSFTINHLLLEPGIYVSRVDHYGDTAITTFDLRMTAPNREPVMNTAEMHTIEHLGATFLRNDAEYGGRIVYFGPMGCRTGFYLLLRDTVSGEEAISLVRESFAFIAAFEGEIPGAKRQECGNWLEHDLAGARRTAADMLDVLRDWKKENLNY